MLVLKNDNSNITVYNGDFESDDINSDFIASSFIVLSYSDFMAWVYQYCNLITKNNLNFFVISHKAFLNALNNANESDIILKYENKLI